MPKKQISPYAQTLLDAWTRLIQNKTEKHKIYTLHEPNVSFISKGKAQKPFEFGSKVSISRTLESGIILGALALPGNPYVGHTVQGALKQIKRLIGNAGNPHFRPRLQRPKGIWQNPFTDSFSFSKNGLSIGTAQGREKIP